MIEASSGDVASVGDKKDSGYKCKFGMTWYGDGASVRDLLTEIEALFVLRASYGEGELDAILVNIWRRLDVERNPTVKEDVVIRSLSTLRKNFEAQMGAFERLRMLSSDDVAKAREKYGMMEKIEKEKDEKEKDGGRAAVMPQFDP